MIRTACFDQLNLNRNISFKYAKTNAVDCGKLLLRLQDFGVFSVSIIYISVSIITNSCTHSSIYIKNTLKVHVKFTPTCFGSQMEPSSGSQQLILAKVYKWFNGAGPYSQYCGGVCRANTDYIDQLH